MNKNYIYIALVIVAVVVVGGIIIIKTPKTEIKSEVNNVPISNSVDNSQVKEFSMTSFYEMVDNKPKPQYSLKEITVKKGDTVKIQVTVTKGNHDFNIDEYNIHQTTPLDQPTVIEFKADKVGEFIYYCSMPGHRAAGHWGTLKVIE